jgi:glutamate formiminotransferase
VSSLIECVPNFSAGRNREQVEPIFAAIRSSPGARLLDVHVDADHNRSVATFVAEPEAALSAAFAAVSEAVRQIDVSTHVGEHPRIGAADVVPFVPLSGSTMGDCVELAHALGERVGDELGVPVFFYGEAARSPERRALPFLRRGGFERLRAEIGRDPARVPDAGPRDRVHPTAGACAIGARGILVAFNVNLASGDVGVARAVAREIRESSGGLPGIRALGMSLASRGLAQVSINICDPERTGLLAVFEAVERAARARGVEILESELVGLAPAASLAGGIPRRVRLATPDPEQRTLEAWL